MAGAHALPRSYGRHPHRKARTRRFPVAPLVAVASVSIVAAALFAVTRPPPAPMGDPVPLMQAGPVGAVISYSTTVRHARQQAALAAVQAQEQAAAAARVAAQQAAQRTAPAVLPPTPAAPVLSSSTDYAATAFGQCVRMAENGGSYSWGTGNGGGAYQFLASTWYGHGAAAGTFGSASPAYQDQIFNNTVAADGDAPWRPYDGCAL